MQPNCLRVSLLSVFEGFEEIDPPNQPIDAETYMNLEASSGWLLEWPKSQIRLESNNRRLTTPRTASTILPSPLGQNNDARPEIELDIYDNLGPIELLDELDVLQQERGVPDCAKSLFETPPEDTQQQDPPPHNRS